jgi:hypothetical protein
MQMNNQKYLRLALAVLLAAAFMPTVLTGAENEPQPEPQPETPSVPVAGQQQDPAQADTGAGDLQQTSGQTSEQPPPVTAATTPPVRNFKPTEKIGADSAVSFPVDI